MQFGIHSTLHVFPDRAAAGVELARALRQAKFPSPLIVLALPRGGVPVAQPVARMLHAPLDVLAVRKIGMPGQPELAIGAIAAGGIVVHALDRRLCRYLPDDEAFERLAAEERSELDRREALYRHGRPPLDLKGKACIIVDDGIATGFTMVAALRAAHRAGARAVVAAAPVASAEAVERLHAEADEIVVLQVPDRLSSIGEWYDRFEQLSDAEVLRSLRDCRAEK